MSKPANNRISDDAPKARPALTPEARENRLISMALDEAERQIMNHTASSQVLSHFLKLGTVKNQLELEKLRRENILLEAKAEAVKNSEDRKELYENALKAMRSYSGYGDTDDDEEDIF